MKWDMAWLPMCVLKNSIIYCRSLITEHNLGDTRSNLLLIQNTITLLLVTTVILIDVVSIAIVICQAFQDAEGR